MTGFQPVLTALTSALLLSALLAGCSGGNSGGGFNPVSGEGVAEFWAADFTTSSNQMYRVRATKAADGQYCTVWVEQGWTVSAPAISSIVHEFDTRIYPGLTTAFGSVPDLDGNSRVLILLLDVRDGFNGSAYIAGYFNPGNQYPVGMYGFSNQKDMLYMDIHPAVPGGPRFLSTLAHELQHMIHWEQKDNAHDVTDDTWLDEAMSEIAPAYCGYGPSYSRLLTFQDSPSDSLTEWNDTVQDYAVVYLWSQYFKDRFGTTNPDLFRNMLSTNLTGTVSVEQALRKIDPYLTFASTFRDWTIANYSGNVRTWPGRPEWSYTSIDTTFDGVINGVQFPGLFPDSRLNRASPLPPLGPWSVGYYRYTPLTGAEGLLTWTSPGGLETAALADATPAVYSELVSGLAYTFTSAAYLLVGNPANATAGAGAAVTRASLYQESGADASPLTRRALLEQANSSASVRSFSGITGEPEPVCVHSSFRGAGRSLRAGSAKIRQ